MTQFFLAAGLTLLANLLIWFVAFNLVGVPFERALPPVLNNYLSIVMFGVGLAQFIYLLPVALYLIWQRRWVWLRGLALGMVLTILVNSGGWVLIASGR